VARLRGGRYGGQASDEKNKEKADSSRKKRAMAQSSSLRSE
jgi:hypothetical protein